MAAAIKSEIILPQVSFWFFPPITFKLNNFQWNHVKKMHMVIWSNFAIVTYLTVCILCICVKECMSVFVLGKESERALAGVSVYVVSFHWMRIVPPIALCSPRTENLEQRRSGPMPDV